MRATSLSLVVLVLLLSRCPAVLADPYDLSGGVLIVHAPPELVFSATPPPGGWCQHYQDNFAIERCADQHPRVDGEPGATGVVWYVLAAWEEPKEMAGFEFGFLGYDPGLFDFTAWGICSPGGAIESPSGAWPGPDAGTMVVAIGDENWSGNLLPVYYFAGYAYAEGWLPLGVNPGTGTAQVVSQRPGASFPEEHEMIDLGSLGLFCEGRACYPDPGLEPHACCVGDECRTLTREECRDGGGVWLYQLACDPQACPVVAACCAGDQCTLLEPEACAAAGGIWHLGAQSCEPNPCLPRAHRLRPDGTGDHPTIQAAVDAATPGDLILLEDGVYSGAGNRDVDLRGKAVTIRSLSGNPQMCTIDCRGTAADRHQAFLCHEGETALTRLEGLRISAGLALVGGAIRCEDSASPEITQCIFSGNTSLNSGGAIACIGGAAPLVNDCRFNGNLAQCNGGGLWCADESDLRLAGCEFEFNHGMREGGGFYAARSAHVRLENCTLTANKAVNGGGGAVDLGTRLEVVDTAFDVNGATGVGGGLHVRSSECSLTDVRFSSNHARRGGGMFRNSSPAALERVVFLENSAEELGGGIFCGGAPRSFTATNVSFARNDAAAGGGFYNDGANRPTLTLCTWIGNTAEEGGGIYSNSLAGVNVAQSTFWANHAPVGAGIYVNAPSDLRLTTTVIAFGLVGEAIRLEAGVAIDTLACCDLYGNAGGDWTGALAEHLGQAGNISAPPLTCGSLAPEEPTGIHAESPCAPAQNPWCGLIGAWPVMCGALSDVALEGAPEAGARLTRPAAEPNPFSGVTSIRFNVPPADTGRRLTLRVIDIQGRVVRTLLDGPSSGGAHCVSWDGAADGHQPLSPGIYFVRLQVERETLVSAVLLTR